MAFANSHSGRTTFIFPIVVSAEVSIVDFFALMPPKYVHQHCVCAHRLCCFVLFELFGSVFECVWGDDGWVVCLDRYIFTWLFGVCCVCLEENRERAGGREERGQWGGENHCLHYISAVDMGMGDELRGLGWT